MTQDEKDLLLKDLCARIPYKVKVQDTYYKSLEPATIWLLDLNAQKVRLFADEPYQDIGYIKPYLFPLSSMTEEQKKELQSLIIQDAFGTPDNTYTLQDFYCKYHLDYRGLIEKDLALNATNLNIY